MLYKELTCPWCLEEFNLEVEIGALPLECPNCGELAFLENFRDRLIHPQAEEINLGISSGVAAHLHQHSLCYVHTVQNEIKIASGTLLQIGDRLLVATASHSLPEDANQKLELVPKKPVDARDCKVRIIDYGFTDGDDPDVGFIELERDQHFEQLAVEPLPLSRVSDFGNGIPSRKAWLFGYPKDYSMPNFTTRRFKIAALSLSFLPVGLDHWPPIEVATRNPKKDRDVLLHYDRSDRFICTGVDELSDAPPEPFGLSGGGLWQPGSALEDDEIWAPDRTKLFAIQSMWPKHGLFLRATQIVHWLKLVADYYPDLKDEIYQTYPRVAEIE